MPRFATVDTNRRRFLRNSSGLLISCTLAGEALWLSPAQAFARKLPFQVLSQQQVATLEALAEAIVPGARQAGLAHFIDSQLSASKADCLLMIRYLGVPHPYTGFYQSSLDAVDKASRQRYKAGFEDAKTPQREEFAGLLASGGIEGWDAPPAGFFFFALRADACDVVYGTEAGQRAIDFPQMAHIKPEREW